MATEPQGSLLAGENPNGSAGPCVSRAVALDGRPEGSRPSQIQTARSEVFRVTLLAHIIYDGSSRNCGVAKRDGRVEARGREADLNSLLTDRAASPPAWPLFSRGQACRSGEYAIAVEALMNNMG